MKKLMQKITPNILTLYQMKDGTYKLRIETLNFTTNQYNPSYDINFGLFSEALNAFERGLK